MKNSALVFIFLASSLTVISQNFTLDNNSLQLSVLKNNSNNDLLKSPADGVKGSPYLLEDFKPAVISIIGTKQSESNMFVRYDIFSDAMQFSNFSDGANAQYLSQARNLITTFDNRTFQFIDYVMDGEEKSGYVEILAQLDNNLTLGIVHSKFVDKGSNDRKTGYGLPTEPSFKSKYQYLLIESDGVAIALDNDKRRVANNFEAKYIDQIKDYIKVNKIRFEDDNKGLIAVAKYYATIKN